MLCPLDARYRSKVGHLDKHLSDEAYYMYRVRVELQYLAFLTSVIEDAPKFNINSVKIDSHEDYRRILEIEKTTQHDVKAIEYFLAEKVPKEFKNFIHLGLTSQDVNSLAFTLMFKDALLSITNGKGCDIHALYGVMIRLINKTSGLTMLSFTHGQAAVYSDMGKELSVMLHRIQEEDHRMWDAHGDLHCKFGGAIGNLNALYYVYPNIEWTDKMNEFVSWAGQSEHSFNPEPVKRSKLTTQIDDYDSLARVLDSVKRMTVIFNSIARNMWLYISKEYFIQQVVADEVGSSTMPHKVNPIHFENAMGNCELLIGMLESITRSLPNSTLQRDLKDSTLTRSLGMTLGYFSLIMQALTEGFKRLRPNVAKVTEDASNHTIVLAEAVQTYLRVRGYENPYELCKTLTRGHSGTMTMVQFHDLIKSMDIREEDRQHLISTLTSPSDYVGKWPEA